MPAKKIDSQNLQVLALFFVFFFGGLAGITAIIYDWFKRNDYQSNYPSNGQKLIRQLTLFAGIVVLVNFVSPILASSFSQIDLGTVNGALPLFIQSILGITLAQNYLHKSNIYLTNKDFWTHFNQLDFGKIIKNMNLDSFLGSDLENDSKVDKPKMMSPYTAQKNQYASPIVVDQTGDRDKVLLIISAFFLLMVFLAYQYWTNYSEKVMERANEVFNAYEASEQN
ncbi:hypothetical protein GW756_02000 [bacterium]|nr:hypothetical protein [bacterium]NCQ55566.1 hypothetical protein [Candidatus Parcubacteria bacterium]NCS67391.1 hypothetical protein [Candidatus Peregrinibacteria bacterium]NCS96117.1 hypothetical protein [bacterium]